ncbi:MAG: hypothetical protein RLZZ427_124 [Pseudomonadota bacterium]|jgi:hypothetical protein
MVVKRQIANTDQLNNVSPIKPGIPIGASVSGGVGSLGRSPTVPAMATMFLKKNGGNGTSGGMNDDWKDSVNTQLSRLHDDVRHLLYAIVGSFLVLGGSGLALLWVVHNRLSDLSVSQAKIETRLDAVDGRLQSIDSKLDHLLEQHPPNREAKR